MNYCHIVAICIFVFVIFKLLLKQKSNKNSENIFYGKKQFDVRDEFNLNKFKEKIDENGQNALTEIKTGKKLSHWMWYIFPQFKKNNVSEKSAYYSIKSFDEAKAYFQDKKLKNFLVKITTQVKMHLSTSSPKTICDIFGVIDAKKFLSCMTLFFYVAENLGDHNSAKLFKFCKNVGESELKYIDKKTIFVCEKQIQ